MALLLTAGEYSQQVAITQAAPPCPGFNPGAIATTGQTILIGGTPATINSTQAATGGDGQISYQWYKNGNPIDGATEIIYTPPQEDAATVSVITYTRRAKDNVCNSTFTPATGSWVLTVNCPSFSPGTIATAGQTIFVGGTPATIESITDASSENGYISYQWYKNGNAISGTTVTSYTPPKSDATVAGAITYTRRAKDNVCNTTLTASEGNWVLTVNCLAFDSGAIATTGQIVTVGGTPITINSVQNASSENGTITYQWYKNGNAISGATAANYTPPKTDAAAVGAHTYTRRAKDNVCNTTLAPSQGSWVLTVKACDFSPGAIMSTGETINVGNTPATIYSVADASGGDGVISYQWYRDNAPISSATLTFYMPPRTESDAVGAHVYTRAAKDNTCSTS
jgi:hypothetical protein